MNPTFIPGPFVHLDDIRTLCSPERYQASKKRYTLYISGWRAGAPPAITRAGDRYSAGCLLERCQQYITRHSMRCARRPPGNIGTVSLAICYRKNEWINRVLLKKKDGLRVRFLSVAAAESRRDLFDPLT
ncbi:hypothetical protein Y032_0136g1958 [Ancylostoma ceylanicum]|uniref:Uncharacterized protein n=1 Tax=Ancylostoma ceylanicum TaxID=53326 RepID=A0A016T5G6_9BILA|nr:hypothetical protein Y032_0136g1958 [Ancylostoma ceylanicum]